MQYTCQICGYVYDEEKEGKKFEELSEDFSCPGCKIGKKSDFKVMEPMVAETKEDDDEDKEDEDGVEDDDKTQD
jgi:rubredoxin